MKSFATQCKIFAAMLSMDFQGYLIIQILFSNECSIYNFTIQWIWLYENLDVMIHSFRDDIGYPGTWQWWGERGHNFCQQIS